MAAKAPKDRYVPLGERYLHEVIEAEIDCINLRRGAKSRDGASDVGGGSQKTVSTSTEPEESAPEDAGGESATPEPLELKFTKDGDRAMLDAVGLALSGGGIRSAAFSLGVLQALNQSDVIRHVDYLSTVSGGGYIGSSLSATMSQTGGEFVFGENSTAAGAPPASDIIDTEAVEHIRNYSNFLIPFGFRDVLTATAIIVRGLAANLGFVLPVLLLAAALTVLTNPTRSSLEKPDLFGLPFGMLPDGSFRITLILAVLGLLIFFVWAVWRSFEKPRNLAEFRTKWPAIGAAYLLLIAGVAFFEVQPFVLAQMFDAADLRKLVGAGATTVEPAGGGLLGIVAASWIQGLAAIAAPIWAIVTFFNQRFSKAIEAGSGGSRMRTKLLAFVAQAAVLVAGAALPLVIWVGYLYFSYWGIAYQPPPAADLPRVECQSETLSGGFSLDVSAGDRSGSFEGRLSGEPGSCPDPEMILANVEPYAHTPGWMASIASWINSRGVNGSGMFWFYLVAGAVLLVVAFLLRPNANSLHRLYRDRLSKAFLFDAMEKAQDEGIAEGRELKPIDDFRLSQLSDTAAPYHLIGCALNLQGSDFANRRGRNADFFMFSKKYVGSFATGYVKTETMERQVPGLDLATAFAVSGAAASSNMGSSSIRALTPTLALLNVRLGFWLPNPRHIEPNEPPQVLRQSPFFMWREISGQLDETIPEVYLTDGGHVENLGAYELLRRKCKMIVVVDAEGDADMRFKSYVSLQRYARIDLGIRMRTAIEAIGAATRAWMGAGSAANPEPEIAAAHGPHIALGKIDYGGDDFGYLIYVKSSLTGDESDYVRDYARRSATYPHESTGDQFFSEEQFEVYRALGFHVMYGFLEGRDDVVAHEDLMTTLRKLTGKAASSTKRGARAKPSTAGKAAKTAPPAEKSDEAELTAWSNAERVKSDDPLLKPLRDMLGLKTPAKG